jgi:hypothetical protein
MNSKTTLSFFTGRIKEIGSALMYDLGNYTEKIPTDIIRVQDTDEQGRLWFFIRRPVYLQERSFAFPASLQFHRKGKNFTIKITGMVRSVNNYTGSGENTQSTQSSNLTPVEMKISSIEYIEYDAGKKDTTLKSWIRMLISSLFTLPQVSTQHSAKITLN